MSVNQLLQKFKEKGDKKKLPPLLKREFHTIKPNGSGAAVRVMQWNILAQALSQGSDNFVLCPTEALDWENRHLHIAEEILTYNPTVLCLEEVDHYDFLAQTLQTVGYEGMWFPKPDSPCLYTNNHNGPDGCALFWRTESIILKNSDNVVLKDSSLFDTNQVSIIGRFEMKNISEGQKELYIAVTHLKSKRPYFKLRHEQGKWLVDYLSQLVGDIPIVICGDFNADPDEKVYEEFLSSTMSLKSAYTCLSHSGTEPPYTTWKVRGSPKGQQDICRTLDYIWYSFKNLSVCSLLKFPTAEELGDNRLPSFQYPSDHLSLVCDFELI
ncbi:nocturnin-like [Gigantopelta aegis]|uniref:nocturnin-like n=1 Tax=Gigantopelta aegis TaxID=1735272 RepID=UPI001B88C369|nr:nocturnin-like [Gigantopelta aegis]